MKIKNQYNKSTEQKNKIVQQENINQSNVDNISIVNSINQYIKKIENLSSDWVILDHLTSESFFIPIRVYDEHLCYEWIINLNFLPEYLIPYLNVQILYKSSENLIQRAFDDNLITFKNSYIIQSEESNNFSKITLIASIFVNQRIDPTDIKELEIEDIEAKLLLTLQNPNNYV